jgi:hypothetical protein
VVERASHLSAADLAASVALRRDRLVRRQLGDVKVAARRQDEIDTLGRVHREEGLLARVARQRDPFGDYTLRITRYVDGVLTTYDAEYTSADAVEANLRNGLLAAFNTLDPAVPGITIASDGGGTAAHLIGGAPERRTESTPHDSRTHDKHDPDHLDQRQQHLDPPRHGAT